jgi:parvulin-like peptidyl-prolyl isomerase
MAARRNGETGRGRSRWKGVLLVGVGVLGLAGASAVVGQRGNAQPQASTAPAAAPAAPRPPTPYERLPPVLVRVGQKEIKKEILLPILGNVEGGTPKQEQLAAEVAWMTAKGRAQHEVLYREAERRGIEMAPEDRASVEYLEKRQQQAQEVVSQVGVDAADAIRQYRETMFVKRLLEQEIYDKVEVSQAELQASYDRSTEAYWHPETFRVRRLLVAANPEKGREHMDAALKRAQELYRRAREKNADFAALARAHSDDALRSKGGLLGEFDLQNSPLQDPRVIQVLRALESGQVSHPIYTEEGYLLVFVEKKTPVRRMTLKEATALVRKSLQYEKGAPAAMQWAEELERAAGVELLIPKPPSLDTPPAWPSPGGP